MDGIPHILVVSHDCEVLTALITALKGERFRITVVSDRATMERTVAARPLDLVLADLSVPHEEVLSVCQRLRETQRLPLILLLARPEEAHAIQGLEYGAAGYLIKPFSGNELLTRIRAVLRRSDEVRP